ncbi:MAG TPA: hypothetical protein EYP56_14865 [Planctomycetaceae bacterium]|nr:hypothetical protein [Planctomycetaceae bacterium]
MCGLVVASGGGGGSSRGRASVVAVALLLPLAFLAFSPPGLAGGPLRLATFQCDVTPPLGEPIYSSYQPLATVEHPLLAKGVVLEDGGRRYVLCALDWCEVCNGTHLLFREKMAQAAGTDPARVAVQTVHQHTAPMGDREAMELLEGIDASPPHPRPAFFDAVARRLATAVAEARGRLEPFDRVGTGQAKVERVASSRRVKDEQGRILVRWSRCIDPHLRAMPEGKVDPWLKTITLARGEAPLVRLHYYATHPQSFYGDPRASYDFPGMAREALQAEEGVFQIYFNGCGGDITAGKYNDGSREARAGLAARLLAGMRAAAQATRFEPARSIRWRTTLLALRPRSDPGYTEEDYRRRMLNPKLNPSVRIYRGAMALAFLARRHVPFQLSSMALGRACVLHLPGEAMIDFQLYAQHMAPDRFVAVAAYGDCACGYLCTEDAFREGGYEPTDSFVTPDSEKALKSAIRQLLGVQEPQFGRGAAVTAQPPRLERLSGPAEGPRPIELESFVFCRQGESRSCCAIGERS